MIKKYTIKEKKWDLVKRKINNYGTTTFYKQNGFSKKFNY